MTINWTIDDRQRLVVVGGRGVVDHRFIEAYLADVAEPPAKSYRKLLDFTDIAFDIAPSQMDFVVSSLTGEDPAAGPVAIVVGTHPLTVDIAVLASIRPMRIFRDEGEAGGWLMFEPRLGQKRINKKSTQDETVAAGRSEGCYRGGATGE